MSDIPEVVLIEDVAKHFKVSVSTIRIWVRDGHIAPWSYIKIGNTYRFNLERVAESLMPKTNATQQSEPKQEVTEIVEKVVEQPLQQPVQDALESVFDADEDQ